MFTEIYTKTSLAKADELGNSRIHTENHDLRIEMKRYLCFKENDWNMMASEGTLPPAGLHLHILREDQSERSSWPETKASRTGHGPLILTGNELVSNWFGTIRLDFICLCCFFNQWLINKENNHRILPHDVSSLFVRRTITGGNKTHLLYVQFTPVAAFFLRVSIDIGIYWYKSDIGLRSEGCCLWKH